MNRYEKEAIRQAKILRTQPDPTGLAIDVMGLSCQFRIKHRCQHRTEHLEYDPTGEVRLPAPACNGCHTYLERAYHQSIGSEEANMRIKLAILGTYEALMEWNHD